MQVRKRDDRGGRVQGSRTERTSGGHHSKGFLAPFFASMVILSCLTMSPAKADFVCNAKTKLVNVFLEPPSYWSATIPKDETASQMRDRLEEEKRREARGPGVWNPADAMEKPFDIVDTLPSGARVMSHGFEGRWSWISFRHSQTGLVGNGYVLSSKLSSIPCDADPKTATGYKDPDEDSYFGRGMDELDDPPLEGARGAKRFERNGPLRLSGEVRYHEVYFDCERLPKDADTQHLHFRLRACTKLLAVNPNYVEALLNRGDIYHAIAKAPTRDIDRSSPGWPADIKRRKEAQEKAIADWTRASHLLGKEDQIKSPILEDRLKPTGAAGYEVK